MNQNEFENKVRGEFPELVGWVDNYSGLLHIIVGSLYRYTQDQIKRGDWAEAEKVIRFVDESLDTYSPKEAFQNAVAVSFLEYFEFGNHEKKIRELFGARLETLHDEQAAYMKELAESQKKTIR